MILVFWGVSQITAVHVGWFIHIIPDFYPCNFALLSSVIIFIYLFIFYCFFLITL